MGGLLGALHDGIVPYNQINLCEMARRQTAEVTLSTTARLDGLGICSRACSDHGEARERERVVGCKGGCKSGCECEVERAACSQCVSV